MPKIKPKIENLAELYSRQTTAVQPVGRVLRKRGTADNGLEDVNGCKTIVPKPQAEIVSKRSKKNKVEKPKVDVVKIEVELSKESQHLSLFSTEEESVKKVANKKEVKRIKKVEAVATDVKALKVKSEEVQVQTTRRTKKVGEGSPKKARMSKAEKHEEKVSRLERIMLKLDCKFPTEYAPRSKMWNGWNGSASSTGQFFVGAHVSAQGGLAESVYNAAAIGARSFALFLRSQRQWLAKPMEQKTIDEFVKARKEFGYPPHLILPHGSYLMNLGSNNPETLEKSRQLLLEELQRCEALGLTHYNFHPGSTCGEISIENCLQNIADSLNRVHEQTAPSKVMTVIENMSKQGNTVGGFLHEIRGIIDRVKDKERVGVCIDTCHAFAAGYDLASEEGFQKLIDDVDKEIGFEYLVAVHLNDSKFPVGSHKDRHENIGKGHIGVEGFRRIMNCSRFRDIPIILETPWDEKKTCPYDKEIELLYSLSEVRTDNEGN